MGKVLFLGLVACALCKWATGQWPWQIFQKSEQSQKEAMARALLGVDRGVKRPSLIQITTTNRSVSQNGNHIRLNFQHSTRNVNQGFFCLIWQLLMGHFSIPADGSDFYLVLRRR